MANLICRRMSFTYDGAAADLFTDLDLVIDTDWRSALVGANGRGKTTLLRLLAGELVPDRGQIERPLPCLQFSGRASAGCSAFQAAKDMAGPFRAWEAEIDTLLGHGDEASLVRYGEIESEYRLRGGYRIDARVHAELDALGLSAMQVDRPFTSLSGGEQTRCLLAGLFAAEGGFPLIDEPTNHLDLEGRRLLADYLGSKNGFLLVSHDRAFLNAAVDHVIALNAQTVDVQRTDYNTWRSAHRIRMEEQARANRLLKKDIARLEATARSRRAGADAREADKTAGGRTQLPSERGGDSGFIGARAARQMKRAIAAERRSERSVLKRRESLLDVEKHYALTLTIPEQAAPREPLVQARNLAAGWAGMLFEPVTFELGAGERLALLGPNGSGKTSLMDLLAGHRALRIQGEWHLHSRVQVSRAWQIPRWRRGLLRDRLADARLDESRFRQLMAALGVRGEVLESPLEHLSQGQQKKIELARSLSVPAHLYLWDEPLNYIDVDTRERIESAIKASTAAFIFIEHDVRFVERLATQRLNLVSTDKSG